MYKLKIMLKIWVNTFVNKRVIFLKSLIFVPPGWKKRELATAARTGTLTLANYCAQPVNGGSMKVV